MNIFIHTYEIFQTHLNIKWAIKSFLFRKYLEQIRQDIFHIVFGCRKVPCRIIFERMKPSAGKRIRVPFQ